MTLPASARVAIVGAGWAGLACAVRLAGHDARVEVFEAARAPGGRARRIEAGGVALDNGQHILIGAYRNCLALMHRVGVPDDDLLRVPLALECPGRFVFAAPSLPAPLHILAGVAAARGLSGVDKRALLAWMIRLRLTRYRAHADATVAQWTAHLPIAIRRWMLDPLCISALNTPPAEASARVFAAVLRDSLGAARAASDLVFARNDLGALFPDRAVAWIHAHGGAVHTGMAVGRIEATGAHWRLDRSSALYDAVVLATPAWRTRALLAALARPELAPTLATLDALRYEPITTVYLRPVAPVKLSRPMIALDPDPAGGAFGQFAFDRTQIGGPWGWIAVVVSAARDARDAGPEALVGGCARQLGEQLGCAIEVEESRVLTEKRATFLCTPGLVRPPCALPIPGLALAGDYTAGEYPATLEQAVRSGEQAADVVLAARRH